MRKLLLVLSLTLLPLSVNAVPVTWYLDDPDGNWFGSVVYEPAAPGSVDLNLTYFIPGISETWTGPTLCTSPACTATQDKAGDSFGAIALVNLAFGAALTNASLIPDPSVGLTLTTTTPLNIPPDVITMVTRVIETPENNPFPPPPQIPAPGTIALFGLGLAGLGWTRRKRT